MTSHPPEFKGVFKAFPTIHSILGGISRNLHAKPLHDTLKRERHEIIPVGDMNELGHAYYCSYYNRPFPQVARPTSSNLLHLYAKKTPAQPDIPVLTMAADVSAPAPASCNVDTGLNHILPPNDFAIAFREIHPSEMVNAYYHHANVCGQTLESFLSVMTDCLNQYFSGNLAPLQQLLHNITKCICLRIVLRSAYYYAHHDANGSINDQAVNQLLQFYEITGLIHPQDEASYRSHLSIIKTYVNLKTLVTTLLGVMVPSQSLLEDMGWRFIRIFSSLDKGKFNVFLEFSHNHDELTRTINDFTETIPKIVQRIQQAQRAQLQRAQLRTRKNKRISPIDMLHIMQRDSIVMTPKQTFDMGVQFMKSIGADVKRGAHATEANYIAIHRIYNITSDARKQLGETNKPTEDELLFDIMQNMDEINSGHRKRNRSGGARTRTKKTKSRGSKLMKSSKTMKHKNSMKLNHSINK
jgi:hypothetical protein